MDRVEFILEKRKITENSRCIEWGMVVKGRNKKPEKDDL